MGFKRTCNIALILHSCSSFVVNQSISFTDIKSQAMGCECMEWLGVLAVAYMGYKLFQAVYNVLYPFFIATPIGDLVKYSGAKWAVVTGSTDGIGKEYALQLAQKGFNLVIVGRNADKLNSAEQDIKESAPRAQVKQIQFDFTEASASNFQEKIESVLSSLDVGVLVNNVGLSYEHPEVFDAVVDGVRKHRDMTIVNTLPTVLLTRFVLPQMLKRNEGVIVNVGSAVYMFPTPLMSTYSAAKSFVDSFTRGLQYEYAHTKLFIQAVHPFLVCSNMSKVRRQTLTAPAPSTYVKAALRTIGYAPVTHGCWPHQAQGAVMSVLMCLPDWLVAKILLSINNGIRAKALKKLQKST